MNTDPTKVFSADKCTAIAVGAKASASGSPMTTHTADCAECDWRVNKVAAQDWPEGAMRPIFLITGAYPRQVREDRGFTWSKANLEDMPQRSQWEAQEGAYIIGYIPQVKHTYALIEGMYGIMNEHQVAIGESTCAAKLYAAPVSAGGKALLEVSELSQIALERSRTAREAILTMGALAEQYGYYSAEWDTNKLGEAYAMGEGGEALTVVDAYEAWMFHILPDDTGASAIWVAQRIPDDHISVVANSFVIREVQANHPDFLYSSNLWQIAEQKGWYDPSTGPLNFLKTYAPQRYHPEYSNLRVWRVLSLASSSDLAPMLPAITNAYADDYPFSIQVSREQGPYSAVDLMWMQRDHYEGTPFSTAEGVAAGPYGDPNRFDLWSHDNMTVWEANEGEFPRTISLFRTSYSIVAEPRATVPRELTRVWLTQYAPDSSAYTPLYIQANQLPPSWIRGTMQKYNTESAWWNFCVVGNYAARFYAYAMKPVRTLQHRYEALLNEQAAVLEQSLLPVLQSDAAQAVQQLTQFTLDSGAELSKQWKELFPQLLTTYRDGYVIGGQQNATVAIQRMFYPRWWLQTVGFFEHTGNKQGILFASNPLLEPPGNSFQTSSSILLMLLMALGFFLAGWGLGRTSNKRRLGATEVAYSPIPDHHQQELETLA